MNAAKVRAKADFAQHLIAIQNLPSWPPVRDELRRKLDAAFNRLVGVQGLSDADVHYGRGYVQGMRVMLEMVEKGEDTFEQAMKAAQALEGAEEA